MADRSVSIKIRNKQTTGGNVPAAALMAEPFVNTFDGVLKFSGTTGGSFEPAAQTSVFEVGSLLYNQKISNRLSINGNFVISGDTGNVTTYGGSSSLNGKFLSGTTAGLVLADISDLPTGDVTRVQPGSNILTGGTNNLPTVSLVASPSINGLTFSGSAIGNNFSANTVSGGTIYSGSTNIETLFAPAGSVGDITRVQPGTNIQTGGTENLPVVSTIDSPSFNNISFSGTANGGAFNGGSVTSSSLTDTRVVFAGTAGILSDDADLTFNVSNDTLSAKRVVMGAPGQTGTTATIYGDLLVIGSSISGFTSQLYVEDNFIELNYNPTADTTSTSLGAGVGIQDGSGDVGTDVFFDVRGTTTGLASRSFSTNLNDIRIRETGTVSAPNGVRLIAENDVLDGGTF
jgi:hypothetical protein